MLIITLFYFLFTSPILSCPLIIITRDFHFDVSPSTLVLLFRAIVVLEVDVPSKNPTGTFINFFNSLLYTYKNVQLN